MMNRALAGSASLSRTGAPPRAALEHQQGVVLLALILVVLVGSTTVLLGKLNARAQDYAREVQTQAALKDARNALLRFALTYPETQDQPDRSPGYLPCPDQDDDGSAESSCAASTGSTLGLLPALDLGIDTVLDSSGGRVWYAVSEEFKNDQLSSHVLNSETRATLCLDAVTCADNDDDVVAVLIAAGPPINGQDDRGDAAADVAANTKDWYEVAVEYLEDSNPTSTDEFYVTAPTVADSAPECTGGSLDEDEVELKCFNDQIITITRRELLAAVEARVANDVRGVLTSYRDSAGGAFPWLVPFADPKRGGRHAASLGGYGLSGRHTNATTSTTTLTDNKADFVFSGVAIGDLIWNLTDGSFAAISAVAANSVTVAGLSGGADNEFAEQDTYYIAAAAPVIAAPFSGSAGAGSSGTTLVAEEDLERFGVVPGDVIDNLSDATSGVVIGVDGDEVEVDSGVAFDPGDDYRVRSALGVAGDNSLYTTLTLVDDNVDFTALDVQADDRVYNLTDGSYGMVSTAPAAHSLTVSALYGGNDNTFAPDDGYAISRYTPATNTRYGMLPLHETGKASGSKFSVKWSLTTVFGNTVTVPTTGFVSTYSSGRRNWIQSSTSYSDFAGVDATYPNAVVADSEVDCVWSAFSIADCTGKFVDSDFLKAAAESVSVSGAIYSITDTGTRFNFAGVRAGAKIRNLSQPSFGEGIVYTATTGAPNVVQAVAVSTGTPFTVAAGEDIQVLVAAKRTPATGSHTADGLTMPNLACTTGANFLSFVGAGDTIRLSTAGFGNPVGLITGAPSADCVSYTDLQGGTTTSIAGGQLFRIQYDFVEERHWVFKVRMAGEAGVDEPSSAGVRQRSVCQGFGSECDSQSAATLFSAETGPVISFTDYDVAATALGTASVAIPAGGASTGSLMAGGLDYLLAADVGADTGDGFLPRWFLRNRWHEYVFVSYADPLSPANATNCAAGTDCVTVNVPFPVGTTHNDREAVVVVAGAALASQDRASDDPVSLADYFEDENADPETTPFHLLFERADVDATFNDQLSAVLPD